MPPPPGAVVPVPATVIYNNMKREARYPKYW